MPSHFTLRMQFGPHQDANEVTRQLLDLARQAPADEIMVFFFAEELNDGHDTLDRIHAWIDQSRPYRRALADAGVTLSLNPWHSLLHCDRSRALKPGQPWQRMVDPRGRVADAVVCPLDLNWQAYFAETLRLYAAEGFRVIWIDDDIRLHNHAPLDWGGCFCPLHVAEFNRRAGTQATREQIVAACTAPGQPHPWRALWMDMWQDTLLALISRWRAIVESGGGRLGLMSSAMEAHAAEGRRWEDWWQAFGDAAAPIHRPHFWGYGDMAGTQLANSIAMLDQNRAVQPPGVESGPEIECFPYGRWNKSFRQIGAQMALAHILGSTNLNISLYDFMGNRPDDEPERAAFLRDWHPACDWLADQFPMDLAPVGIGVPWSQDMGRSMRTDGSGAWQSLSCPSRGWAHWLGATGHAFCMRPSPHANALAGPAVWSFSEAQLRAWLAQGVLLDGIAAGILVERGLGDLIGAPAARFVTQRDVLYSVEHCLSAEFGLREGAQMSVNDKPYAAQMFQAELAAGARIASDLRSPTQQVVGHGLYVYENALGGRVAVFPWSANAGVEMNVQRATQLAKTLDFVDPAYTHGSASGGAWLVPQFLTDGRRWRGAVWNASPDEIERITVHRPAGMPPIAAAVQVDAHGVRRDATVQGDTIQFAQPLHQWEFVVLLG